MAFGSDWLQHLYVSVDSNSTVTFRKGEIT